MKKDKLVLLAAPPENDLVRSSRTDQYQLASFVSHIENADNPRLHMFVASNNWNELIIQMKDTDALPALKLLSRKFAKVTVFLFGTPTSRVVQTLCELFPDKSASLRRAFMSGEDLGRILNG